MCFTTLPPEMNTLEIDAILRENRRTFKEVYASDELPTRTSTDSIFVCYMDPSDQPSTHWIVVYVDEKRKSDYFDSFGMAPTIPEIELFLNNNSFEWTFNDEPLRARARNNVRCMRSSLHIFCSTQMHRFWYELDCLHVYQRQNV